MPRDQAQRPAQPTGVERLWGELSRGAQGQHHAAPGGSAQRSSGAADREARLAQGGPPRDQGAAGADQRAEPAHRRAGSDHHDVAADRLRHRSRAASARCMTTSNSSESQTINLSKQTLQLDRLQREYNQNKAFLEDMLARSNEADIASTASLNNVRVIEPARRPDWPYSPNVRRTVMLATFLGLFFGIGLVLGLDYLDHTLRSPDQVEKYLGLETLTALPTMTEDNTRVLRESFQSLRTAIMLASRGEDCHIVMVTSAVPEEGKTTVAFNLAKVLATGGSRVLLIDADLRKPRIHRMIKAKNVRGLTSVVLGERSAIRGHPSLPERPQSRPHHLRPAAAESARALRQTDLLPAPRRGAGQLWLGDPRHSARGLRHRSRDLRGQRRSRPPRRPVRLHQAAGRARGHSPALPHSRPNRRRPPQQGRRRARPLLLLRLLLLHPLRRLRRQGTAEGDDSVSVKAEREGGMTLNPQYSAPTGQFTPAFVGAGFTPARVEAAMMADALRHFPTSDGLSTRSGVGAIYPARGWARAQNRVISSQSFIFLTERSENVKLFRSNFREWK